MMKYSAIIAFLFLTACGGDDEVTSANSDEITFDTAPKSFTSKPNDEELLALLRDGIRYDIKLGKGNGWNTTHQLRKRWHKNYNYKVKAALKEYPDAEELIYGEFRFQINGTNYELEIRRSVDKEYLGIPLPSIEAMQKLLDVDLSQVLRKKNLTGDVIGPIVVKNEDERKVLWHSPKSFSINVDVTYSVRSGEQLITKKCRIHTKFSRESNDGEFVRVFGGTPHCKDIGSKTYTKEEFRSLPTHEAIKAEKLAQAEFDSLVEIEIPEFEDDKEAMRFIYNTMYTGDKATVKAMIMKMFAPRLYIKGTKKQLGYEARKMLDQTLMYTFDKETNFQNSYCPQMLTRNSSPNYATFTDALNKLRFRLTVEKVGGEMVRGEMVGAQYKIRELDLFVMSDARDVENLKSWPLDELCKKTEKTIKAF